MWYQIKSEDAEDCYLVNLDNVIYIDKIDKDLDYTRPFLVRMNFFNDINELQILFEIEKERDEVYDKIAEIVLRR